MVIQVLPGADNWDSNRSNKHDHIVWECDFFVHPAILRIRQFISKWRSVTHNVLIEGRSCAISCLNLDRNDCTAAFNKEFNLMYTVWLVVIQRISPLDQAFRNDILINTSTGISSDGVVQNSKLRFKTIGAAEQAGVIDVELELISIGIRF